jgi:hypothetical protein
MLPHASGCNRERNQEESRTQHHAVSLGLREKKLQHCLLQFFQLSQQLLRASVRAAHLNK